jgi:hypothetical protein
MYVTVTMTVQMDLMRMKNVEVNEVLGYGV